MQEILHVSKGDVGRIAVSKNGEYRVKVLGITSVNEYGVISCLAESLRPMERGTIFDDFGLVGGGLMMYWEDDLKFSEYPERLLDISAAVHASEVVNQVRDVFEVMAYLTSETGECADWLVNPDRQKEDLLGECADVIICALDLALIHKQRTSGLRGKELTDEVIDHLNTLIREKADKWVKKHAD